jgi:hypothetical protein
MRNSLVRRVLLAAQGRRRGGVAPAAVLGSVMMTLMTLTLALGAGSAVLGGLWAPAMAQAQTPAQRVVQGKVEDGSGAALKATVYLKDEHTLAVRSYETSDDGMYHFGQLAQSSDYQIWAQAGGKKSSTKNISSFDTRSEFNITLKVDKK